MKKKSLHTGVFQLLEVGGMLPLAAVSIASERPPMQAGTMASKCHTLIMETNAAYLFPHSELVASWIKSALMGNRICVHLRRKAGKSYLFQGTISFQSLSEAVLF